MWDGLLNGLSDNNFWELARGSLVRCCLTEPSASGFAARTQPGAMNCNDSAAELQGGTRSLLYAVINFV